MLPSKSKFRVARQAAGFLSAHPKLGFIEAIFVTGSVAANLAVPESDIDLLLAVDRKGIEKRRRQVYKAVEEFQRKRKYLGNISASCFPIHKIKLGLIGKLKPHSHSDEVLISMLKLGIPLYLNKTTFSTQYSLAELTRMLAPRRRAIEEEYVRPRREGKSTLVSRLVSNRKNVRRFIN